jgi:hypothetical protein
VKLVHPRKQRNGHQIPERVIRHLLVQRDVDRHAARPTHADDIAVWRGFGDAIAEVRVRNEFVCSWS